MSWTYYDKRPRCARDLSCGDRHVYLTYSLRRVQCSGCGGVKSERLDWLADNPLYTKRFALFVGRRCRETPIQEVAEELRLDWHTVKELDKQYMREQLRRAGNPAPRVIGIDEIAIAKGHQYRIVVSDLERSRPIWFGGQDRSEASLDEFFAGLGPGKCSKIRWAVMDRWQAFRNSTRKEGHAPQAAILYDKFHVLKHLGEAMDQVRKREYARRSGKDRRFVKGQRYALLSHWENLSLEGRKALRLRFKANKRLNTAYLLKESFDQLWDYQTPGWARRFFSQWRDALRWQRWQPFQKFAQMIEAHWDGIEAYGHEENKVPLGFVEGFNNKLRTIQRRAYGLRDEEYLRLKILTCMLSKL
ncbi:MAG: ISL3 family transposase [Planctomycetia bacterium]|nr:ISL3 family transposase [Planctomycetia bacterium]